MMNAPVNREFAFHDPLKNLMRRRKYTVRRRVYMELNIFLILLQTSSSFADDDITDLFFFLHLHMLKICTPPPLISRTHGTTGPMLLH
jgi:hypothetical protein